MPITTRVLLPQAIARLKASATDTPVLDAELLLAHAWEKSRSWLRAFDQQALPDAAIASFHALLAQRENGIPIAHLLGQREFWSLPLRVSADTLIPRPDTELLVEQALLHVPQNHRAHNQALNILELGTGSGAIALALAKERPTANIVATDISRAALAVARDNACTLKIDTITFIASDWFTALPNSRFNIIVSNPPYIAETDPHLQQGDVQFEPRSALVAGKDGLAALRLIIAGAAGYLAPGGWLLVEHGHTQADAVQQLFSNAGFVQISSERDLAQHRRVTKGAIRA